MHKKYFYLAIIVFFITAIFSLGHNHPDEYHQILGFAAYKLGILPASKLQWEFAAQMRPSLQPAIIVALVKIGNMIGIENPFTIATISRILAGILSLLSISVFINAFIDTIKNPRWQKWFVLMSLFGYLTVYNGIRFSSESFGGGFLLLGFSLLFIPRFRYNHIGHLLIGIILGLSFISRFQMGFAIVGLIAWLIYARRISVGLFVCLSIGFLISLIGGVILDHWLYGEWVFTPWNYFAQNILAGKASSFGEESPIFYLALAGFIPLGPLFIFGTLGTFISKPKHAITWTILPFVLAHLIVGHKELRFLVPIIGFMPICIIYTLEYLSDKYVKIANYWQSDKCNTLIKWMWGINCFFLLCVMFTPSATQLPLGRHIYDKYQQAATFYYITEGGNILDFYKRMDLTLQQIQTPNEAVCQAGKTCLVALTCQQIREYNYNKGQIVYSNCPSWIFKLDFNNWLERTALYNVYDISN